MHWDIKALVFLVIDDLDRCLFLHSSPVSNNFSSGLASPCSASLHHFHTSSDISFQTGLCRELSPHLSCSFQGVSVSDSNPCLDVFLLALFFVPFCIWTCSILPALLSLQVSVLRTPHRTLSLCGSSDADSNWLNAICLQIWPLAMVQSGVWQWQCNFHTLLHKQSDCTIAKTCLGWTFSKCSNTIWAMCETHATNFLPSAIFFYFPKSSWRHSVSQQQNIACLTMSFVIQAKWCEIGHSIVKQICSSTRSN